MSTSRKVALVTGGARGIGRVLTEGCARMGYAVAINYLSSAGPAEALAAAIRDKGGEAIAVQADASRADDVQNLVATVVERFGRIDALINNAGAAQRRSLQQADEAHFDQMLATNLKSAFLVTQAVVPKMIERGEGGRLVFFSSLAARTGGVVSPAYAASKAALEGLMHYYATYLLPHRITSNAIAPGVIESDMTREMNLPPVASMPLGRLGRAEEMWPALQMILETEYMTGQTVHLNAGRYMT